MTLPTNTQSATPLQIDLSGSDQQVISGRTIILYGDSGLTKTTQARFFSQLMYELTGKPVALIAFEDSSKTIFQPLIDTGIVKPVFMPKAQFPVTVLRQLAKQKFPIFGADGKVDWVDVKPGMFSAVVVEGLTSGSETVLEFFRENGLFLREQKADAVEIGGSKISPASQTAIYTTQGELLSALKGLGMWPVERVLWTAHEAKGEDSDKAPIRGPGLVGKAATNNVQKWCGILLHAEGIKQQDGTIKPRIYFQRHSDPMIPNLFYPAKVTMPVEQLSELKKTYPNGYFEPGLTYGTGLDAFLRREMELVKAASNDIEQWKKSLKPRP